MPGNNPERGTWDALTDNLGAEPIEQITHRTGKAALVLLLVTLAVTPVRRLTGWNWVIQLRRLLGLFAFFYACLHFATYLFDQYFDWAFIWEDVAKHPYVTVGFAAFLLLIPLAATSTRGMIRRVGGSAGSGCTAWYTCPPRSRWCTSTGSSKRTCGSR